MRSGLEMPAYGTIYSSALQKLLQSWPWRAAKNRHCADMTQRTEAETETETETKAKAGAVIIPVTLFEQNCTLIWCEATKKAVVIDPGGDVPKILAAIKQSNVSVEKIWLTHGHIDHVGGAADMVDMAVGQPDLLDRHIRLLDRGQNFRNVAAGVDHHGLFGGLAPYQRAVLLEQRHRNDDG